MLRMRRSEVMKVAVVGVFLGFTGCGMEPDIEDVVNYPAPARIEEKNLTRTALDARIKEIDGSYAETRMLEKVQVSFKLSLDAISRENNYDALWRAVRACAWIALDEGTPRATRLEYAMKGMSYGRLAAKKTETRVEPRYYLALSIGAYLDLKGTLNTDLIREMENQIRLCIALDEQYDYCGPHRFLGELIVRTKDFPLLNLGNLELGLEHLKRAATMCPTYGENCLFYARALIKDDQKEAAKVQLEKVIASPKLPDLTVEHDKWLKEAADLMTKV
jgi:hypothetical protein